MLEGGEEHIQCIRTTFWQQTEFSNSSNNLREALLCVERRQRERQPPKPRTAEVLLRRLSRTFKNDLLY